MARLARQDPVVFGARGRAVARLMRTHGSLPMHGEFGCARSAFRCGDGRQRGCRRDGAVAGGQGFDEFPRGRVARGEDAIDERCHGRCIRPIDPPQRARRPQRKQRSGGMCEPCRVDQHVEVERRDRPRRGFRCRRQCAQLEHAPLHFACVRHAFERSLQCIGAGIAGKAQQADAQRATGGALRPQQWRRAAMEFPAGLRVTPGKGERALALPHLRERQRNAAQRVRVGRRDGRGQREVDQSLPQLQRHAIRCAIGRAGDRDALDDPRQQARWPCRRRSAGARSPGARPGGL